MSAYRIGLLLALGVGVNLAWGENTGAAPNTNPIGKVLTATGAVRIDHSTAITVQANLPKTQTTVRCELVSDPSSLLAGKKTGNFHCLGLARPPKDAKYESRSNELRGNSLCIGTANFLPRNKES